MANTVLELIAQNVGTTLASVPIDVGGTAYTVAIGRALALNEPRHLKGFIFQLSPDDIDDSNTGAETWRQSFAVVAYVMPLEDDPVPADQYNNAIAGAIHKALMTDYTRGGHAIDTKVKPTLYFPPVAGEFAGITFQFDVLYRHVVGDPFAG